MALHRIASAVLAGILVVSAGFCIAQDAQPPLGPVASELPPEAVNESPPSASPTVTAAPVAAPAAEAAAYPYIGEITGDDVYVRSGPAQVFYPVTKLGTGQRVVVTDTRYGWAEIEPTVGCFSYVSKEFVELLVERAEATDDLDASAVANAAPVLGRITGDRVRVRAGSIKVVPARADQVQFKLNKGNVVEILGERDDFYKIVSPKAARFWIAGDFVKRVGEASDQEVTQLQEAARAGVATTAEQTTAQQKTQAEREEYRRILETFQVEREKPVLEQDMTTVKQSLQALVDKTDSSSVRTSARVFMQHIEQSEKAQAILKDEQERDVLLREMLTQIDRSQADAAREAMLFQPRRVVFKGMLSESLLNQPGGEQLFQVRDTGENIVCYATSGRERLDLSAHLGKEVSLAGILRYEMQRGQRVLYVTSVTETAPTPGKTDFTEPELRDAPPVVTEVAEDDENGEY